MGQQFPKTIDCNISVSCCNSIEEDLPSRVKQGKKMSCDETDAEMTESITSDQDE